MYHLRHSRSSPKPWFEREGGKLLREEQALVSGHYPGLAFRIDTAEGRIHLVGDFFIEADCGVRTPIRIRVDFPANYPADEPTAYDDAGTFSPSLDRHILKDGQFCLWLPPCTPWDRDDPRRLLRFLDEVTVFLERQLIYEITRKWPGGQYDHGAAGYRQFMLTALGENEEHLRSLFPVIIGTARPSRNDLCPCGSNRKYKRCHAEPVESIIYRIGRARLDFLYRRPPPKDASSAKL